jgi:membrane-bound lytic murein transglycosylase
MKSRHRLIGASCAAILLMLSVSAYGQIYRYFTPGSVGEVSMIRIHSGMDQAYMQYLDTELKKESDAAIKNGFMKSYKILRSQGDDAEWNMLIMREYESFASLEKNAEKADEVLRQATGLDDQKGMQGYTDRAKIRDVVGVKFMREIVLK